MSGQVKGDVTVTADGAVEGEVDVMGEGIRIYVEDTVTVAVAVEVEVTKDVILQRHILRTSP